MSTKLQTSHNQNKANSGRVEEDKCVTILFSSYEEVHSERRNIRWGLERGRIQ